MRISYSNAEKRSFPVSFQITILQEKQSVSSPEACSVQD